MNLVKNVAWPTFLMFSAVGSLVAGGQKGPAPTQPPAGQQGVVPGGNQAGTPKGMATNFGGIQQNPWFNSPQTRQQVNMNDAQFNQLNNAHQQAWTRYQKGINGLDKNLTNEQRQQRIRELDQNYNKEFSNTANTVFTDPQQRQRYNQLDLQYRGYGAFDDPMVAGKLKLTDEQRAKIGQYRQDWSKQMNDLASTYQTDPAQASKRFSTMQTEADKRLNTVLTPQQQQTWRQMTGEPYSFQPNVYFPNNTTGTGNKK